MLYVKTMNNKILEVKNLYCGYDKKQPILKNLNFEIYEDEFIGIVGPNSSGKTTLIKTLLGIISPLGGEVIRLKKGLRFGYVPQIFSIDETYPFSVYDVLSFAFLSNFKNKLKDKEKQKINEILKEFNIEEFKIELYRNLSGGLKQKVLICRSILRDPDILILDEPANDLDIYNTKMILEFIKDIKKQKKLSVILVTHTLQLQFNFVDKLFLINNGRFEIVNEINNTEFLQQKIFEVFKVKTKILNIEGEKFIKL